MWIDNFMFDNTTNMTSELYTKIYLQSAQDSLYRMVDVLTKDMNLNTDRILIADLDNDMAQIIKDELINIFEKKKWQIADSPEKATVLLKGGVSSLKNSARGTLEKKLTLSMINIRDYKLLAKHTITIKIIDKVLTINKEKTSTISKKKDKVYPKPAKKNFLVRLISDKRIFYAFIGIIIILVIWMLISIIKHGII